MPPKGAPGPPVELMLRSIGGEPANMATLAPKLGPLGVPPKKASDAIMEATKEWKGLRVTVKLIIENRQPRAELVNSSTALILKALNEPPRDRKKVKNIRHDGNLSLKDIIDVAQKMRERSQAKKFSGTVCEILGTANAVGCTVEGQRPQAIIEQIKAGSIEIPE
eukprot:TRINITY_DN9589_c1_g1_i1.p2 TRINITY_DN9589_c1_g1~~TRINITY_DN9589_c1_g1_i1.p2  ORF type:complete len:165 (-),score=35.35 TRINITY_DN9589_c1_g1_i1:30-524(-)